MHIVRFADAPFYDAPGHMGMTMRRLQGREAGRSDTVWMGHSTIEPHGGTIHSASSVEKFYVVLSGRLRVEASIEEQDIIEELGPMDSCRIEPGESRKLTNVGEGPCVVLLVMPVVPL